MRPLTPEQEQNLRNAVRAVLESPIPAAFTMGCFIRGDNLDHLFKDQIEKKNWCNTPACVIGHYASRADLQCYLEVVTVDLNGRKIPRVYEIDGDQVNYRSKKFLDHFGLAPVTSIDEDNDEADELFGAHGCDNARTPAEAAAYIERFIEERNSGARQ